ncbi:MAG: metallophosphoesterase [Chthoniobacterales bacterium]|nr:metallophosphoesterase [Chthoniobacterales bacterium]
MAKLTKVELKAKADALAKENVELRASLAQAHAAHVAPFTPIKREKRNTREDRVRVQIPDSHGMYADSGAIAAFLADLKDLDPDEIVMTGDHVDCGGFLAAHHTLGYVAQMEYSYEQDIAAANEFLNAIQANAPRAKIHYLEGNHEGRVERWCVTQALGNKGDAEMMRKVFAPQYLLDLKGRGIPYYRRSVQYMGLPIPGAIKLGKMHYIHEMGCAKHAAADIVARFGGSVRFGHTHRSQSEIIRNVAAGVLGAWNPGCLCILQQYYSHSTLTNQSHGYGVELITPSDHFLSLNVPIINGISHLSALMRRMV